VSDKLADLARRRESLILRSGGQRERLAESCEHLARSVQWAHIAKGLIRKIKDNPGALMGVTAFLGSRRTKFLRVTNWLSLGWALFQAFRARRARRRA
jgi:YqjK-like protein